MGFRESDSGSIPRDAHHPHLAAPTHQPDRRRRGRRAAGVRGQGTGREQPGCRRVGASRIDVEQGGTKLIRVATTASASAAPAGAGAVSARDQQDRESGRSGGGLDPGLSRRGAAEHRLGVAAQRSARARATRTAGGCADGSERRRARSRRPMAPAPASRCATCSTTCRRGASSCAPRRPSSATSSSCCGAWRWPTARWRCACSTTVASARPAGGRRRRFAPEPLRPAARRRASSTPA
jgi:hypothetical protein